MNGFEKRRPQQSSRAIAVLLEVAPTASETFQPTVNYVNCKKFIKHQLQVTGINERTRPLKPPRGSPNTTRFLMRSIVDRATLICQEERKKTDAYATVILRDGLRLNWAADAAAVASRRLS